MPPCLVSQDADGYQAIEVNLKWFEIQEIRKTMVTTNTHLAP